MEGSGQLDGKDTEIGTNRENVNCVASTFYMPLLNPIA